MRRVRKRPWLNGNQRSKYKLENDELKTTKLTWIDASCLKYCVKIGDERLRRSIEKINVKVNSRKIY
jgi:hypothetical protein